ncbi:MAG: hypothetical protein QNJ30_19475 [Kiloniellales bacterium]|nr:hypothetical protein [Kiloniellales bacterium]
MGRSGGQRALLILLAGLLAPAAAGAADFEKVPQNFKATDFVPQKMMSGEGFSVGPEARNDGYINTYALTTDWGELEAVGDYRLRVRLQEIQALKTLDSMSRAGQFGEGLKNGVLSPIEGAYNVVTSPIETTSGAVKGVGRWFGNIANSITSDDPNQEGALSAAAGWAGTKRAFAVELGVDPYTDWEPLQEALVSVARAAFAGGMTASVGMGVATQDTVLEYPVLALSLTEDMNKVLIDNPPAQLTEIHEKELLEMEIDEGIVATFLRNYNYSPLEKLLLVEALKRMPEAQGRELFLTEAGGAPDKAMARYFQQRAEMMSNFHNKVAATDIVEVGELVVQKTKEGRLVGIFPLDYLLWSAEAAAITQKLTEEKAAAADVKSAELWFEGRVSQPARAGIEALGWTVKEQAGLLLVEAKQE